MGIFMGYVSFREGSSQEGIMPKITVPVLFHLLFLFLLLLLDLLLDRLIRLIQNPQNLQRNKKNSSDAIWMFPKIGVPQNGWFLMEIPY